MGRGAGGARVNINNKVDTAVRALAAWRSVAGDIGEAFGYLEPVTGLSDHRGRVWGATRRPSRGC